ncbi:MAG: mercury resistance system transport protein MerF [Pseudomonadota bacterium]
MALNRPKVFLVGAIGALITAVCCFTPLLVWLLPAIGLATWVAEIDAVLFPVLAVFLAVMLFGAVGRGGRRQQ